MSSKTAIRKSSSRSKSANRISSNKQTVFLHVLAPRQVCMRMQSLAKAALEQLQRNKLATLRSLVMIDEAHAGIPEGGKLITNVGRAFGNARPP